ncbi:MAG: hypothetical protein KGL35_02055 [Bradyrhizobium sp.]|nr:hypothetical protein [Bradyrhizobium sp.]
MTRRNQTAYWRYGLVRLMPWERPRWYPYVHAVRDDVSRRWYFEWGKFRFYLARMLWR